MTTPLNDDFNAAQGIVNGFIISMLIWAGIGFLVYLALSWAWDDLVWLMK